MSWREVVLDLETYRTREAGVVERLSGEALEKRPSASASKGVRDGWDTSSARQERVDEAIGRTSVDVTLAEVVCVVAGEASKAATFRAWGDDELEILRMAAAELNAWTDAETVWVGHNIEGFDLGILLNRWRHWGIRPPEWYPVFSRGRWHGRVFDTMQRVPTKAGFVTLEEACRMYRVEMREVMWRGAAVDGSRVGAMVDAAAWDELVEYCVEDVGSTGRLYTAMTFGGMWGTLERSAVWDEVSAVKGGNLGEGAKALAIVRLLEKAGII